MPDSESLPSSSHEFDQHILDQIRKLARRMLRKFPNVRRWDETDDVASLAALRVWKTMQDVQIQTERHHYRLVAKNIRWVLLDLARKHGRPGGLSTNVETWHGHDTVEPSPDLSRWAEFHEVVEQLNPEDKDVFDLLWYSGVSCQQAADLLGITRRALMYRWRRAKLQAAKVMGGDKPVVEERPKHSTCANNRTH